MKLSEKHYLIGWLLCYVGGTVAAMLMGFVGGILVALLLSSSDLSPNNMFAIGQVVGFLISIPVNYATFRLVVQYFLLPRVKDREDLVIQSPRHTPEEAPVRNCTCRTCELARSQEFADRNLQ